MMTPILRTTARAALFLVLCFTTASFAQILSVSPSQNALNIPANAGIVVTFSQDMMAATINNMTFVARGMQSGLHQGKITYDVSQRQATLTPSQPFTAGEMVLVVLTNDIRTGSNQSLSRFSWHFVVGVKRSTGKFTARTEYSAGSNLVAVVAADLDGDRDNDLAVTDYNGNAIYTLKNDGRGIFSAPQSYEVGNRPGALAAFDLENDGDMDLAVPNQMSNTVTILRNIGTGQFQKLHDYTIESEPVSVCASDFDNDGDLDLAIRHYTAVTILKNRGNSAFENDGDYPTDHGPGRLFAADFDSDGDIDLAATVSTVGKVYIWKNDGLGKFVLDASYLNAGSPYHLAVAEMDGDGDWDLATTSGFEQFLSIFKNNGAGNFSGSRIDYSIGGAPAGVFAADWNGDGFVDLALANSNTRAVSIFSNNGAAAFQKLFDYPAGDSPSDLFGADFDGDGDTDLAAVNSSGKPVALLINRSFVSSTVATLNAGRVYLGNTAELNFRLFNLHTGSATITHISSSSSKFTVTSRTNFVLAAGDSEKVTMVYKPSAVMDDTGTVQITLQNFSAERVFLYGSGAAPAPIIAANTASLDFGNVSVNKTSDLILNLSNTGVLDLNIANITRANSSFAIIGGTTYTIQPGETKPLLIEFTPSLLGSQKDTLKIFSNDPAQNPLRIPMTGNGVTTLLPEIAVQPLELKFDSVLVRLAKTLTLRLYNRGAANLNIMNVTSNNIRFDILSAKNFNLAPGDSSDITIKFGPVDTGLQTGTLNVTSNDGNENPLTIKLSGIGKATPAPTLTKIFPALGNRLQTLNVGFKGTNFIAGLTTVNAGANITVNSITVQRPDSLTANLTITATAATGGRDFSVTNPFPGGGTSARQTFTINNPAPTLTRLNPGLGNRLQTLNVGFKGANFINGVTTVNVGTNITVNKITVDRSDSMTVNLTIADKATIGAHNFSVLNNAPGGGTSGAQAFAVNNPAPTLTQITPNRGELLQTLNVGFKGTNFISGVSSVNVGANIKVNSVIVQRPDSLTANMTIAAEAIAGQRNFSVTNSGPAGGTSVNQSFTVGKPTPILTVISPTSGNRLQTLDVGFKGANFINGVTFVNAGPNILINKIIVHRVDSLTANITISANANLGVRNFSVSNGSAPSEGRTFTIKNPAPTLTRIAPASAIRGRNVDVVFTGTNFISKNTVVNVGLGIVVNSVIVNSATSLTANLAIQPNAERGPRNFSVTNISPNGGTSGDQVFVVANNDPTKPRLLSPANNQLIQLSKQTPALQFLWSKSSDADPEDTVKYAINLKGPGLDTTFAAVKDTSVLLKILPRLKVNSEYSWDLRVSDGWVTVTWSDRATFRTSSTITAVHERDGLAPSEYRLEQNYPNPFKSGAKLSETTIQYQLPKESAVTLRIYDMLGREVITLVNALQPVGYYEASWNGKNRAGELVPAGVYLCRLQAGSYERVMKMMVVR